MYTTLIFMHSTSYHKILVNTHNIGVILGLDSVPKAQFGKLAII